MRFQVVALAAAAALLAAGCDRNEDQRATTPTPPPQSSASGGASVSTPSTPANVGRPSQEEKKDASPVQGQVDATHAEQHKDFQQRGDHKGPTDPATQPKRGN